MTQYRLIGALTVVAVIAASCGSQPKSLPTVAPLGGPAAASPVPAGRTVPARLQFTAKTVDGQDFNGESLLGKPAVLWFWAPWCLTCQAEAPMVGQVAASHPEVTFVGVAGLDQVPAMQEFVDRYPVKKFTHLADADGSVWVRIGVTQQPAFAFIGPDGSIDVVAGRMSEAELARRVTALANQ
ncbi:protein disulfide oxidoreductase [Mycobacterium riyadhense]|uniref:Soluble secreted antigen MPT53 n=1 Tax=Mycobacterium riyadhense TaxID=486698 RepID=A0A1X2CC27_9MYCO|nr:protein disulfide oxidoreductase [Mycobacterium riyadhense]MCV7146753.1 protein disulfide oxidoreductase [Mycobacterium riyadhense]ORW73432.1 disulfide bond formation protein DsbF [Mycobacterium riyadhense]